MANKQRQVVVISFEMRQADIKHCLMNTYELQRSIFDYIGARTPAWYDKLDVDDLLKLFNGRVLRQHLADNRDMLVKAVQQQLRGGIDGLQVPWNAYHQLAKKIVRHAKPQLQILRNKQLNQ